jgi:hypothetical protein
MRTIHWLFVVSVLIFITSIWFLVVGARNAQNQPVAAPPVATVRQIMQGIVVPASTAVYNAVSTTVSAKGVEEVAPRDNAEWEMVGSNAAALIEASNMLMVEGRAKEEEEWATQTRAMADGANQALKATQAGDKDALLAAGDVINQACDNCHQKYQIQ